MGAFWAEKVEFFCQKGLQFVKQSAILICVANKRRNYARLAQLVEHLLDVQEVTGSSPVPRTAKRKIPHRFTVGDFSFCSTLTAGELFESCSAVEPTAACGGCREAEQAQRSQKASPAQGAQPDAVTASRALGRSYPFNWAFFEQKSSF